MSERASVHTGLGEGWRIHWWTSVATGAASSIVEVVVRAPTGAPYTVSLLAEEPATGEWWPAFEDMLLSMEPLD